LGFKQKLWSLGFQVSAKFFAEFCDFAKAKAACKIGFSQENWQEHKSSP